MFWSSQYTVEGSITDEWILSLLIKFSTYRLPTFAVVLYFHNSIWHIDGKFCCCFLGYGGKWVRFNSWEKEVEGKTRFLDCSTSQKVQNIVLCTDSIRQMVEHINNFQNFYIKHQINSIILYSKWLLY